MTSVVKNTTFPFYFEAFPDLKYYLVVAVVNLDLDLVVVVVVVLRFQDP